MQSNNNNNLIEQAKEVLDIESRAISRLRNLLDENFVKCVELLFSCRGRVIVTGIGKSGLIARKIAATLASTGTPAIFLHTAEGIHGDLGVVVKNDVVLAVSNSGETKELLEILPIIKRIGAHLVALTGNVNSGLAQNSDIVIYAGVEEEACPLGLAPTASTTAMVAMGDAIAIALLNKRDFKPNDFALLHPGGNIGRKMLLKVEDIMKRDTDVPVVSEEASMKEAIIEMTSKKMGCTSVVNKKGVLVGIVTDQDIRWALERGEDNFFKQKVKSIMTKNPKTISGAELVAKAILVTEEKGISTLLITDKNQKPVGIVHLHDLLKIV